MRIRILLTIGIILFSSVIVLAQLDFRFNSRITISSEPVRVGDNITFNVRFIAGGLAADNF